MQRQSHINVGQLLSASLDLARASSAVIRKVQQSGDMQIHDKGGDDPMTIADTTSQKLIISGLMSLWPDLQIVGEEDTPGLKPAEDKPRIDLIDLEKVPEDLREVPTEQLCVFIDPLDATKEYTLGRTWCVMTLIGIARNGTPVAGVMNQPFVGDQDQGHAIYGMPGIGVIGLQDKSADREEQYRGKEVAVTSASHGSKTIERAIELTQPEAVMRAGGAGYKSLLVMNGTADIYLYPQPGTKRWDTCAPEAVLKLLGGRLTDAQGNQLIYESQAESHLNPGVIATVEDSVHKRYIEKLSKM